jgi:hypothetical protein
MWFDFQQLSVGLKIENLGSNLRQNRVDRLSG